jgi:hypothetical protein
MPKRGRPFEYQTDEERPVTVSLRIPRDLYARMEDYRRIHRQTVTELLLDSLQLRLDTPADPRDLILSDDNTVIQELQEMIRMAVEKEVAKISDFIGPHFRPAVTPPPLEAPAEPVPDIQHDRNTVLQDKPEPTRGRPRGVMRQRILTLLAEHPEGLSPEQIRVYLNPEKSIGDVLQGMRRAGVVELRGEGYQKRYFLAAGSA